MRSLHIDFQRRPAPSGSGWFLLAIGAAAIAALVHAQGLLGRDSHAQAARLAELQRSGVAATDPGAFDAADDPAVVAARQVLDRAKLPWGSLFAALESADSANVAVLAIAPEPARRQVKIHAEARNLGAMLAFQRQLQAHPALAQVVLVDHTVAKDLPFSPVRFHLLATWGVGRGAP